MRKNLQGGHWRSRLVPAFILMVTLTVFAGRGAMAKDWPTPVRGCEVASVMLYGSAVATELRRGAVVLASNDAPVPPEVNGICEDALQQHLGNAVSATVIAGQLAVRNTLFGAERFQQGGGNASAQTGRGPWLAKLDLDPKLPLETKYNFEHAIAVLDTLFARYGLRTPEPVSIVVTADTEGYIQALMTYAGYSREEAEQEAHKEVVRLGGSSRTKPYILVRWRQTRVAKGDGTSYEVNNPEEAFHSLPHELFHQVQRGYRLDKVPVWLTEGPASVFLLLAVDAAQIKSIETARIRTFAELADRQKKAVLARDPVDVAAIFRVVEYKEWEEMTDKGLPTYSMAVMMSIALLGTRDFEKIITFYGKVDQGADVDSAFLATFGVTIAAFEKSMNDYIRKQRGG